MFLFVRLMRNAYQMKDHPIQSSHVIEIAGVFFPVQLSEAYSI
jgi:hypothetical protein